jgi:hypothetical protein
MKMIDRQQRRRPGETVELGDGDASVACFQ